VAVRGGSDEEQEGHDEKEEAVGEVGVEVGKKHGSILLWVRHRRIVQSRVGMPQEKRAVASGEKKPRHPADRQLPQADSRQSTANSLRPTELSMTHLSCR
jgi:hypothetical protein